MAKRSEQLVRLSEASRLIPTRPSVSSLWRWSTRGISGVRLETRKIGGQRFTTESAVERFLDACNANDLAVSAADSELS